MSVFLCAPGPNAPEAKRTVRILSFYFLYSFMILMLWRFQQIVAVVTQGLDVPSREQDEGQARINFFTEAGAKFFRMRQNALREAIWQKTATSKQQREERKGDLSRSAIFAVFGDLIFGDSRLHPDEAESPLQTFDSNFNFLYGFGHVSGDLKHVASKVDPVRGKLNDKSTKVFGLTWNGNLYTEKVTQTADGQISRTVPKVSLLETDHAEWLERIWEDPQFLREGFETEEEWKTVLLFQAYDRYLFFSGFVAEYSKFSENMNNERLGEKRKAVMEEEVSKIKKQKQQPAPPSFASSSSSSEQPSSSSKGVPAGEEASPLFLPQASPLASILSPLLTPASMDWMAKNPEGTKTVASFLGTVLSPLLPQAGAPELAPLPESQSHRGRLPHRGQRQPSPL
uniref:Transmembrane protein n=1 Tax=Chromera velia CCMP2878 TaxID=1169474 RepID=A0A0G4GAK7_9ALVE|eukprot:Cvel_21015.t1-p1 / transcript=Cvel_21015.t1 / gene=Cvel_21015 / organism=Chromera_velia_CCMP2878 / gene_product=hypothetical protein / transcript_product=hypothetical protein / location=Cvel_scaffold1936:35751-37512(-) / protein_length=397 / sequence_SO=supercontig / SO=protein_coding / is_pseudo=false